MAYFGNDAVNRVNLHSGVVGLAQSLGGVFFLVFLLRSGLSAAQTLSVVAAIMALRFALRPLLLPLAVRWGLKRLFVAGALLMAGQYFVLAEVEGIGAGLALFCAVSAVGELVYYLSYNAYFAAIGDVEHRGHQVGVRQALMGLIGVLAPLAGTWGLLTFGPRPLFALAGVIQACSALPLLGAPDVTIEPKVPGAIRAARFGALIYAADGWFDACFIFVWQVALFAALGESYAAYGGAMALAGLVGAVCSLWLGKRIDLGGGARAAMAAYGFAMAVTLLCAASLGSPWLAALCNALGALTFSMLIPTLASAVYNIAHAAPCPLRFQLAAEGGWDVGCGGACLAAAALLTAGGSLGGALLLGLPALVVGALLLLRYYADQPAPSLSA